MLQAGLGLGVEQMTTLQFLRTYLCTATASLPAGPRDAAFLRTLEDLPRLRRIDSTVIDELRTVRHFEAVLKAPCGRMWPHLYHCCDCTSSCDEAVRESDCLPLLQVAFVPTTGGTLMPPSVLHDPRNADLVALLDAASAFPAGAFAADAQVRLVYKINNICNQTDIITGAV